ncbi:radical SAM protein [Candidatus Woesearchaeota archaeon]|nr:radical SAM protein [Candidatus Woesearchaeota archaeon]
MERPRYLSRNELFGKTVYDSKTLSHMLMTEEDFVIFAKNNQVEEKTNIPTEFAEGKILQAPVRVYYDLTLECNLRCRTCLNKSGKRRDDELSIENALKTVEGISMEPVFDVKFSGGEPTLKTGWDEIMQTAKACGLIVTMNTNGIYSRDTLDKIIRVHPDEITVSIDGYREKNDYIRGKGSFEMATDTIKALKANGCRVTINTAVTSILDEYDIHRLIAFADEYCDDISFFHARPLGRAINIQDKLLNYSALDRFMRKVEAIREQYPGLCVETRNSSLSTSSIDSATAGQFRLLSGGPDGFTRFNVMYNGDIFAGGCALYVDESLKEQLRLGNILQERFSLRRIWRESEKLQGIRELSHNLKTGCEGCSEHKTSCGGFTLETFFHRMVNGEDTYCIRPSKTYFNRVV